MHIKLIVPAIAIASAGALAAGVGSASAAEHFTTLEGIPIEAMSAGEMAAVWGQGAHQLTVHRVGTEGSPGAAVLTTGLCNGLCPIVDPNGLGSATDNTTNNVIHWAGPHTE